MKKLSLFLAILIMNFAMDAQQREDMNLQGEKARLKQGRASGEVTRREAKVVREEMKDVRDAKVVAKADGVVTADERKVIAKEDRQLDRTIHRVKHNNRRK